MIQPKFELGQEVYIINHLIDIKKVYCDLCNGSAKIKYDSPKYGEVDILCPKCNGVLEEMVKLEYKENYIVQKDKIIEIKGYQFFNSKGIPETMVEYIFEEAPNADEEKVFATYDECLAQCEKLMNGVE